MSKKAILLLGQQLRDFQRDPISGISVGLIDESDIFKWQVVIMGPTDTPYEGGIFKATLHFPEDYPNNPPKMRFITKIFHPNIYKDGRVCISILHPPGDDPMMYESSSERWLPVHTPYSILVSIVCMLSEPNIESPADVDAARLLRSDKKAFNREVGKCVRDSLEDFFEE
ncbi:ubiquitin-conjugating enzyme E2 G1 [Aduncisulcus paluster]|uniref:Ubiquitin-conjugating enzyme E2 G1 n=1 Tax=Aduncisulcus paluster TaxID=2918883 RepID=A0ABQ5KII3_9EUKA|nr:ubiquitin-conjugating enzyme E2 G1 [Aduncisulcus paluster]